MNPLKSIVSRIPHSSGVYRFLDKDGTIIYVGKAVDLKKRVSSYFAKKKNAPMRLQKLVEKTVDLEYTVVDSELEALILETNLIKSYRPRYNILMKDDKSYVYLKITVNETYPRVMITRRVEKDGARYFGPRSSSSELRRILEALKRVFPYRHCQLFIQFKGKLVRNVEDHIKRCFGVCSRKADPKEYREVINQVISFFEGKTEAIESSIKEEMALAAGNRNFELAAKLRDRLLAIEKLMDPQRVSAPDHASRDVIGLAVEGGSAYVTLFMFRDGKLINQENFILNAVDVGTDELNGAELENSEILAAFVQQYYERATDFPKEVLVPELIENASLLEDWVDSMVDHKLNFLYPKRGKNVGLIDLANDNAKRFAKQSQLKWQAGQGLDIDSALDGLKKILKLPKLPNRIECYDISHLGGTDTVGSMVVFEKGLPKKSDYRHFKLRTVQEKIDDYKAMGEVLDRRFRYLVTQPSYMRKPKKKELEKIHSILEKEK